MMVEKAEVKAENLLNLDDLLQCPVCYEIPLGQIFQCNEGHHVCGRCKMRLDVCPVCRALFFGTRNYAMEELIANFRKLRALKSGNKSNTGSGSSENNTPAGDTTSGEGENEENDEEETSVAPNGITRGPPQACKGLFRCLCCKSGNGERLPAARLLNHLRYFHAPDLIEGRSENGEYLQAWQFGTSPGKLVTAIRVADMGIFFLTIEIFNNSVCAWLSMAASPWITQVFNYTLTLCGNDREAIFSDCVYSVRSCEGTLRKNGHCLVIKQADARPLIAPAVISGKLSIRRTPPDQLLTYDSPRVVMRIANRGNNQNNHNNYNLEPFLQDLQNDVARLSRAFANIGRDAVAVARSEAELRARFEDASILNQVATRDRTSQPPEAESQQQQVHNEGLNLGSHQNMSRNARRRMRQRLRAALNDMNPQDAPTPPPVQPQNVNPRQNGYVQHNSTIQAVVAAPPVPPPVNPPSSSSGPSQSQPQPQTGNGGRNKKKRRHRR